MGIQETAQPGDTVSLYDLTLPGIYMIGTTVFCISESEHHCFLFFSNLITDLLDEIHNTQKHYFRCTIPTSPPISLLSWEGVCPLVGVFFPQKMFMPLPKTICPKACVIVVVVVVVFELNPP